MISKTSSILFIFLICVLQVKVLGQQSNHILFGATLNSSPNLNYYYYNNYDQIHQLGLNTASQRAVFHINADNLGPVQPSNLPFLRGFQNIIAANDSAAVPGSTKRPENYDWIYYYTNALFTKWEAEGSDSFLPTEAVGVKHGCGYLGDANWHSGGNAQPTDTRLVYGHNYSQYMKYAYTNKLNNNPFINYTVNFRMKLGEVVQGQVPICNIKVRTTKCTQDIVLVSKIITANELSSVDYHNYTLDYSYENIPNPCPKPELPVPPGGVPENDFFDSERKIHFEVEWYGIGDLYVDYIEVFDQQIWKGWFIDDYNGVLNNIQSYNQRFVDSLSTKLKYYTTIAEPHSIDCFEPIRRVQEILDARDIKVDLLTQFYPAWDGIRDGVNIMEKWVKLAKPKKLFWCYYPYWTDASNTFGLNSFCARLQDAHNFKKDFYVATQTWAYQLADGRFVTYRKPTPSEVTAQTLLSLAYGAKGVVKRTR